MPERNEEILKLIDRIKALKKENPQEAIAVFGELYERYRTLAVQTAYRMCLDTHQAFTASNKHNIDMKERWAENEEQDKAFLAAKLCFLEYEDAKDIAEAAMLKAYVDIEQYDPLRGAFATWLSKIIESIFIDALREKKRKVGLKPVEPGAKFSRSQRRFNRDMTNFVSKMPLDRGLEALFRTYGDAEDIHFQRIASEKGIDPPLETKSIKKKRTAETMRISRSTLDKALDAKIEELKLISFPFADTYQVRGRIENLEIERVTGTWPGFIEYKRLYHDGTLPRNSIYTAGQSFFRKDNAIVVSAEKMIIPTDSIILTAEGVLIPPDGYSVDIASVEDLCRHVMRIATRPGVFHWLQEGLTYLAINKLMDSGVMIYFCPAIFYLADPELCIGVSNVPDMLKLTLKERTSQATEESQCLSCGKPIQQKAKGRRRRFCDATCRKRYERSMGNVTK